MTESRVPATLLARVERDLRPVRPLASPTRRALRLAPLGLLLLVGVPLFWGWRGNLGQLDSSLLGITAAWGLSALQTFLGLLIVGAALREAVPGRALSASAVAMTIGAAIALVLGVTAITDAIVPTAPPSSVFLRYAWECWIVAVISALPALALVAWLASRALPARPATAGAIYGLGAALMADSGVRLFCWVSEPSHVLLAHGGAIVLVTLAGALLSTAIERFKARA
jgi:hypothetical protein